MNKLCEDCQEKVFIEMMGSCSNCDGATISFAFLLCDDCAEKMKRCQICGESLKKCQIIFKDISPTQPPIKVIGSTQPPINLEMVAKALGTEKMTNEEIAEFFRKYNIPYRPGR